MCAPTSKLLLKSMPCTMDELGQLIQELKLIIPRSLNSFGRRRVLLEYSDAAEAAAALAQLLGLSDILDKPLRVSCFGPKAKDASAAVEPAARTANKATQATAAGSAKSSSAPAQAQAPAQAEINKYVQKLYACNNQFDFTQPPPPYLRYAYPPINDDILQAIGTALKSDKRFYVQVLHLMNRMNLEPPFAARPQGISLPALRQSIATQTEQWQSETESELESDEEHRQQSKHSLQKLPAKRAAESSLISEQFRKRARQLLQAGRVGTAAAAASSKVPTDSPSFTAPKIELKLPTALPAALPTASQRLTPEQLQELPVYKNYKLGEPSSKLYIKNLHKSVTEQQLRALYARYAPAESLEIKLMQQGRMKGQAFVQFNEHKDQAEAGTAAVVAQALSETNGLLWQQKPMIVCYGKQQQQQQE
ncbi:hypothetical protein KR222_003948 [Zaprionus bogoriensis]|nr:hypothetical protein KR222_003948 [Zaprionus bogoriensis]